jgi:hypothetical protein
MLMVGRMLPANCVQTVHTFWLTEFMAVLLGNYCCRIYKIRLFKINIRIHIYKQNKQTNIHIYIHTYIRTHVHIYIHTYIDAYIHTYTHRCIHTYTHTWYIHTYIHTFESISQWPRTYIRKLTQQPRIIKSIKSPTENGRNQCMGIKWNTALLDLSDWRF